MPNPNFTPLSHEELRELWKHGTGDNSKNYPYVANLVLSAIWWMAMADGLADELSHAHPTVSSASQCPACGSTVLERFSAKLREVGIDWREDG